jgi:hypothetical protein
MFLISVIATAQTKIIVKAEPLRISLKKQEIDTTDFHIYVTVINNSDTTIKIPPYESDFLEVNMKMRGLGPKDIELYAIDRMLGPTEQLVKAGDTAKIKVFVAGSLFKKRRKNNVSFFVPVTLLKTKTPMKVESNKIVVNVE